MKGSFLDWLFGPRTIKVDLGERCISELLYVTSKLDKDKMLLAKKEKTKYTQVVGYIFSRPVTCEINFKESV